MGVFAMLPRPAMTSLPGIRAWLRLAATFCACAIAGTAVPAAAGTVASQTQASIVTPLSLVKTADMNFGNIAMPGAPGTVVLAPASTCTTTGGLVHTGACQAAAFAGSGTA